MKTFTQFMEDGMGGGAPATSTAGVAGAGDNPQKIVPVFRKKKSPVLGMVTRKVS
jgi:hypothetical protein